MKATMIPLVAGMLLVSSCVSIQSMPVGRPTAPRTPGCAIREERVTPKEAQDRYDQVGVLCYLRTAANRTATLVDDVRDDACRLGGEIVVREGFCSIGRNSAIELGVYVVPRGP